MVQRPWLISPDTIYLHEREGTKFSEILAIFFRFLRRHPDIASTDECRRLLRHAIPFQVSDKAKFSVREQLSKLLIDDGDAALAYDLLPQYMERGHKPGTRLHDKTLGLIRKKQWLESMQSHSMQNEKFVRFQDNPRIWRRASRTTHALAEQAKHHLCQALVQNPQDADVGLHLIEICTTQSLSLIHI